MVKNNSKGAPDNLKISKIVSTHSNFTNTQSEPDDVSFDYMHCSLKAYLLKSSRKPYLIARHNIMTLMLTPNSLLKKCLPKLISSVTYIIKGHLPYS